MLCKWISYTSMKTEDIQESPRKKQVSDILVNLICSWWNNILRQQKGFSGFAYLTFCIYFTYNIITSIQLFKYQCSKISSKESLKYVFMF